MRTCCDAVTWGSVGVLARATVAVCTTSGLLACGSDEPPPLPTQNVFDREAPSIAIESPARSSTVADTVFIRATATDDRGVFGVQFLVDGIAIGAEDTSAPFIVSWATTTIANGTHVISAVARDSAGNSATSAPVNVIVANDLLPPNVTITSPIADAVLSDLVIITATATDDVGVRGVQFWLDGAKLGAEDIAPPYALAWPTGSTPNGVHQLSAVARDAKGRTGTSPSIRVVLDNDTRAPTVAITAPARNATVSGDVRIDATASDDRGVVGVEFLSNGVALAPEDTDEPFSIIWPTLATSNGSHSLTARARDAAGKRTTSAAVAVTVFNDRSQPVVALTAPASGATVSGTITVTATASDDTKIAGVQFTLDGTTLGTEDTTAPFQTPWNTRLVPNGQHVLVATARDAAGKTTSSAPVTVTVSNDVQAPIVALTAPAAGATVAGVVLVSASATDDRGVAGVVFRLDGVALGAEDTAPPYELQWATTSARNGTRVLTAVARDSAGNIGTSASVTVVVANDLLPPVVAITAPRNGNSVSGLVSVTVNASDDVGVVGVRLHVDAVAHGTEDTTAPFVFDWDVRNVAPGSHVLTATARDAAGRSTTSAPVTVTVGRSCPGGIVGNPSLPPTISIDSTGINTSPIRGTASNVDASKVRVVLMALTNYYYVQPFVTSPFTSICSDGTWSNVTHGWRRMVALLVDQSYTPPAISFDNPAYAPGVLAWAQFPVTRPDNPILFSGHQWGVKAAEVPFDPGPNVFSDSPQNVWVDGAGMLHLATVRRNGVWTSSEVHLLRPLGYGVYTWQLASPVDALDPIAVFSPFIYESLSREIDIEFSRALATPLNAQFVVQPWNVAGNRTTWTMPADPTSSHRIEWRQDRIVFTSWRGWGAPSPANTIFTWTYTGPHIPPPAGPLVRMNLWHFGGRAPAASTEVVIRAFTHQP